MTTTAMQRRRQLRLKREVAQRTAELAEANRRISQQNRQLEELSRTDPLTGIGNRRVLAEQLPLEMALVQREVARPGRLDLTSYYGAAVLMIDLDHFKSVNDRWGHEGGDRALRSVAQTLTGVLREVDLVVRWGGEEFVVLGRSVDADGARSLAVKLMTAVADTRLDLPNGESSPLSATIGLVTYPLSFGNPLPGSDWTQLVDAADRLMYLGKERGRARVCGMVWAPESSPETDSATVLRDILDDPTRPIVGLDWLEVTLSEAREDRSG